MGMANVTWIISGSWRDLNISHLTSETGTQETSFEGLHHCYQQGAAPLRLWLYFCPASRRKTCGIKELLRTTITPGTCRWAELRNSPTPKDLHSQTTFTVDLTYGDFPSYLCLPFISYLFLVRGRIIFYGNLKFKKQEYFTNLSLPKINSTGCGV